MERRKRMRYREDYHRVIRTAESGGTEKRGRRFFRGPVNFRFRKNYEVGGQGGARRGLRSKFAFKFPCHIHLLDVQQTIPQAQHTKIAAVQLHRAQLLSLQQGGRKVDGQVVDSGCFMRELSPPFFHSMRLLINDPCRTPSREANVCCRAR
jgi:hypothetical protein